jgi:hypothetical protein
MNQRRITVGIDRLVIDGLPLGPERAAFLGWLAAKELEQLLQTGPGIDSERVVGRVIASPLSLSAGVPDERAIARGVAQRIASTLQERHNAV